MCVCVSVCACVCICMCMYMYTYVCMYGYECVSMYVCVGVCMSMVIENNSKDLDRLFGICKETHNIYVSIKKKHKRGN